MANGTRTLTLLFVLVVGIGVGWLIFHRAPSAHQMTEPTPTPTPNPTPVKLTSYCPPKITPNVGAKTWKLYVGDADNNPCIVLEDGKPVPVAVISYNNKDTIEFAPKDPKMNLAITLYVPETAQLPFTNLQFLSSANGMVKYLLVCDPAKPCSTGPAISNGYCYYQYDQTLGKNTCDAGIIIQP